LLAESLHVSGVLAVVTAGIVSGNTSHRYMSASTRLVVYNFWEYAAFIANSFIFLLIGLAIDLGLLVENWRAIAWAILAALVARFVSIYAFSLFGREISAKWKHVIFWGGLRGAITLALALSLPNEGIFVAERGRLQAMAFGVVLFTLLVQGISMDWLVRRLRLVVRSPAQDEYELRHARFVASRASFEHLRRRTQEGMISEHTWQKLSAVMKRRNDALMEDVKQVISSEPDVEAEELDTAYREALRAQRSALTGLLRDGVITEETYSKLTGDVDEALMDENPSARLFE
jgi:CPA1 family monovalent cation:H+ antiporter